MMLRLIKRAGRAIARWHHLQHVRDCDHVIRHHERLLAGLPAEIRRINEIRRYHQGRAATLTQDRNPVSFAFIGGKSSRRIA